MELSRNKKSFGLGVLFGAISIALSFGFSISILTFPYTLAVIAFLVVGEKSDLLVYWVHTSSFPQPTMWTFAFAIIPALLIYGAMGWVIGKIYYHFKPSKP